MKRKNRALFFLTAFLAFYIAVSFINGYAEKRLNYVVNATPEQAVATCLSGWNCRVALDLPIDKAGYYVTLQHELARQVPQESKRPCIDLRIHGTSSKSSVAILGGMGPLSDARILECVISRLKGNKMEGDIHLLSAPPPRTFIEILTGLPSYLIQLRRFLHQDHHMVYLASNTAHIHYRFLNWLGKNNIVDLTAYIADQAKSATDDACVLILGTKKAHDELLYDSRLEQKGVRFISISFSQQLVVQEAIDKIKEGIKDDSDEKIYSLVEEIVRMRYRENKPVNILLIGCTELSILLEAKRKEIERLGLLILDSEKLFIEKICNDIATTQSITLPSCATVLP